MSRRRFAPALTVAALALGLSGCGSNAERSQAAPVYVPVRSTDAAAEKAAAREAAEREAAAKAAAKKAAARMEKLLNAAEQAAADSGAAAGQMPGRTVPAPATAQQGPAQRAQQQAAQQQAAAQRAQQQAAAGGRRPEAQQGAQTTPALAFAARINLVPSDLPGSQARPAATDRTADRAFARCVGGTSPERYLSSPSPTLMSERIIVSSQVALLPTREDVAADYRAWTSPKYSRCIDQLLQSVAGVRGEVDLDVTTRKVPLALRGVERSFSYRHRMTVSGPAASASMNFAIIGMTKGRTTVGLTVLSGGDLPEQTIQRLAQRLAQRTQQHAK